MPKEFMSSTFSKNPLFDYMPESDKYLFKKPVAKYRFVVIGAGMIGLEHIKCTLLEGRAGILGIYDVSALSIEKTLAACRELMPGGELKVYPDLDAACSDPDADALLITTPNFTHLEVLRTAVKYDKHIFMEKPMATGVEDAAEIVKIARGYRKTLQIGLQYRYKAIYREARHEAIERRSLGDIKSLFIMEHRVPFLDKVGQWNKFSRCSGGTFVEKCCHYFDLFNLFA
ncbi:MAG: Gfo/Idh/MocA family oxidoreductase, partial [Planctomycetota bacterium]|nr:Gfo/Idh/MocA family oxidoreductase [Planctomycetota bacterium]